MSAHIPDMLPMMLFLPADLTFEEKLAVASEFYAAPTPLDRDNIPLEGEV